MKETSHGFGGLVLALALAGASSAGAAVPPELRISVLSGAPSRVTGGDALVEIVGSTRARVTLNGTDVTGGFAVDPASGRLRGLVAGLKEGANTVTASAGGAKVSLTLTDYPLTGPVFSGPRQTPFVCETQSFKLPDGKTLGPSQAPDCWAPANVQYLYRPTGDGEKLKPYDPNGPRPADLARTTTTAGATVDFIVRLETGVINRAVYQIAMLAEPGGPTPTPVSSSPGWNGVLVYAFGGGCGAGYRQGRATDSVFNNGEMENDPLAKGYAVASATLNVFGQDCNDVTSAETTMMVKEHFVEGFGPPRYTIGLGGSGGALQQHLLVQNYPGLLDGLILGRSFPDMVTHVTSSTDCGLLNAYFAGTKLAWTAAQKAAVSGFYTYEICEKAFLVYAPRWASSDRAGCDPAVFAGGGETAVRCSYYDNLAGIYGTFADGRTRRPLDNVGVEYGLAAFRAGAISAEQFVDLNAHVGGFDLDGRIVEARTVADPVALARAYDDGQVDEAVGLEAAPILDVRSYLDKSEPADVHVRYTSFAMRARLLKRNGTAANQVIWTTPTQGSLGKDLGDPASPLRQAMRDALAGMDRWLGRIKADRAPGTAAAKVLRDKPADLADGCLDGAGQWIREPATYTGPGRCNALYPSHGDVRIAAGQTVAKDILKCVVRPLGAADYGPGLSADQRRRLAAAFPLGVCDYSRPGVGQAPRSRPWRRYGAAVLSSGPATAKTAPR